MKRRAIAIVSDIHANLIALETVLADIEKRNVDAIYCLGDVIGFGPDPRACLKHCQSFDLNLMGGHEESVLFAPIGFNPEARMTVEWTKDQLYIPGGAESRDLWEFVASMLEKHVEDDALYVHGSPREPIREYIFISDIHNAKKMDEIFGALEQRVCFNGHTHVPGISPRIASSCHRQMSAIVSCSMIAE